MHNSVYCPLTSLKPLLFQMRPARQLVRMTAAVGVTGFPAILVNLLTRLGYRWYPEYSVYEDLVSSTRSSILPLLISGVERIAPSESYTPFVVSA